MLLCAPKFKRQRARGFIGVKGSRVRAFPRFATSNYLGTDRMLLSLDKFMQHVFLLSRN